jgi:large subunit ribosomal protein L25
MAELIKAMSRTEKGSTACNRVRRAGFIPAVLNGDDCGSLKLKLDAHGFEQLIKHHTGVSIVIDIAVDDGAPIVAILDELQIHPVKGQIIHADFREVSKTKKLRAHVEIVLTGEPVGISQDQGILDQTMHDVEVECLYTALVESIEIDISELKIGDKLTVAEVVAPEGVTILSDSGLTIASVILPAAEKAEEEEVAAEGAEVPETEKSE